MPSAQGHLFDSSGCNTVPVKPAICDGCTDDTATTRDIGLRARSSAPVCWRRATGPGHPAHHGRPAKDRHPWCTRIWCWPEIPAHVQHRRQRNAHSASGQRYHEPARPTVAVLRRINLPRHACIGEDLKHTATKARSCCSTGTMNPTLPELFHRKMRGRTDWRCRQSRMRRMFSSRL